MASSLCLTPGGELLSEAARGALDGIAGLLREASCIHLAIEKHTDCEPAGDEGLSEARASAVAEYLEVQGVAPAQLAHMGSADAQSAAEADAHEGGCHRGHGHVELWAYVVPQERHGEAARPALQLLTLIAVGAVTLPGRAPLSRVAGSALSAMGLPWGPALAQAATA